MAPLRGWSARGKRLNGYAPHRHWKSSTFLAGLRRQAITAPFVFEGPINGEIFKTYVADVLVPTLRPGDIVVMDNLGSHKGRAIRELVRKAGARVWLLPPYSPDLNPIERRSSQSSSISPARLRNARASAPGIASASC